MADVLVAGSEVDGFVARRIEIGNPTRDAARMRGDAEGVRECGR